MKGHGWDINEKREFFCKCGVHLGNVTLKEWLGLDVGSKIRLDECTECWNSRFAKAKKHFNGDFPVQKGYHGIKLF